MVSTDAAQYVAPFVTPLAGLWVIYNAIFSSPGFVNKMRGTIVSGVYEKEKFTREHARALLIDWALCMIATVVVCFIFSVIVFSVSLVVGICFARALLTRERSASVHRGWG